MRAVLFDAGNTVVFPRVDLLALEMTRLGYAATSDDFFHAERVGKRKLDDWLWPQLRAGLAPRKADYYYWTEYLRALVEQVGVPEARHVEIETRMADAFKRVSTWSSVDPGTMEYLVALRQRGYHLGIVSNALGQIEAQLQCVGLAACFEFIVDSHLVGVEKPHPEIFQMALARCGLDAAEALFVGDLYSTDIGGAQNAGLDAVLIDRVGAYPEASVARIASLPELDEIIETAVSR